MVRTIPFFVTPFEVLKKNSLLPQVLFKTAAAIAFSHASSPVAVRRLSTAALWSVSDKASFWSLPSSVISTRDGSKSQRKRPNITPLDSVILSPHLATVVPSALRYSRLFTASAAVTSAPTASAIVSALLMRIVSLNVAVAVVENVCVIILKYLGATLPQCTIISPVRQIVSLHKLTKVPRSFITSDGLRDGIDPCGIGRLLNRIVILFLYY